MNDAFYEQLVARKSRPTDPLIRVATIGLIAAVCSFHNAASWVFRSPDYSRTRFSGILFCVSKAECRI